MDDDRRAAKGRRIRRQVLGAEHVTRTDGGANTFSQPFQDFLNRYVWGEVWARPGLDRRSRSMITMAVLIALGQEEELARHIDAARRNGVTEIELQEVLLHTAIYAGVPAANRALSIARETLKSQPPP
jgi:4-carboxymuconolactone decarboxylase